MVTTIQLQEQVKSELDRLKEEPRETYEDVIRRLIKTIEIQKRKNCQLLIEGCKEMAEDSLKICKEWEAADAEWPEWKA